MRRFFSFLTLAMVFAFASCMKEEVDLGSGSEETVRFSVSLPQQEALSRAAFSDPALEDMRVVLMVMYGTEDETPTVVHTETKTGQTFGTVNFDVRLVTGKPYTISVWADFGDNYYSIVTEGEGAPKVTMNNMETMEITGSDNKNDAYFAIEKDKVLNANEEVAMTLKRPFGLVRIQTLDHEEDAVVNADLLPTNYTMTVKVPTEMSLLDGTVPVRESWQNVTFSGNVTDVKRADGEGDPTGELSFDYFFASNDQANLDNFTVKYSNEANPEIVSYDFTNIPVRRNYKTSISGNILTKKGTISVTVDPSWEFPDYTVDLNATLVELTGAGSLNNFRDELENATSIRIVGAMNGEDLKVIQDLLKTRDGMDAPLKILDLSEVTGLTNNVIISPDRSGSMYRNNTLETIILPEGITSLGAWSFAGFQKLTRINIPSTVQTIGMSSFRYCTSLEKIVLPEGITEIPTNCFWNANALKSINIPSSVTKIRGGAFSFTSLEGDLILGENLEIIEGSAFYSCHITSVDMSATKVTSVEGMNAFAGCSNLAKLILPQNIVEIGTTAFSGCPLSVIDIPATVEKIANNAFSWGSATEIICRAVTPPTLSAKIYPSSTRTVLKVPARSIDAYRAAVNWNVSAFKDILEID